MKIDESLLTQARVAAESDPVVKALLDHYVFVTENPAYKSYIVRRKVMDQWNKDLMDHEISILNPKGADGRSLEKRDKEIERIQKFLDNQLDTVRDTEALRKMLNEEETVKADKALTSGPDRAFG